MKHLKPYKIFESQEEPQPPKHSGFPKTEEEVHIKCKRFNIKNYTINDDLSIDVDGDVRIRSSRKLKFIPLNFNYVSGDFHLVRNNFVSLEGSPRKVGRNFNFAANKLTSLKYAPEEVRDAFDLAFNDLTSIENLTTKANSYDFSGNQLKSLKGAPKKVNGDFSCDRNQLKSLKYGPEKALSFSCCENDLDSLEHCPKEIGHPNIENVPEIYKDFARGGFAFSGNNIKTLKHIPKFFNEAHIEFFDTPIIEILYDIRRQDNFTKLMHEFNHYRVIVGDVVYKERLEMFCSDFDLDVPDLDRAVKYYKIV